MQILSLDVHSRTVKAAVLDGATALPLGPIARAPLTLHHPTPDAVEVLPHDLWSALTTAARQACRDLPGVEGIGLSVVAPWLVLLDKADQPLGPIWTQLDRRARPAARQVWAAVGDELLSTTGNRPLPGCIAAVGYRQQLNDDPYLLQRVRSYLPLGGWLALCLTGQCACDRASACLSGLFGTLTDRQWSTRWCDFFEVDRAWLPPVLCGSTTIGTVRAGVAAELGVSAGIPLKLGTTHIGTAMLAAGMASSGHAPPCGPPEGDLLHHVGQVQSLAAIVNHPKPSARLLTHLLGVGDACVQVAHNPVGGFALEWIRNLCFQDQGDEEFLERTLPAAVQRAPREVLDPPYLAGDPMEIEAHRGAFRDLTLTTDRFDLLAAVAQALQRGHGQALDALAPGRSWQRWLLSGGKAELVRRLLPNYTAERVETVEDGTLRGVARLFGGD